MKGWRIVDNDDPVEMGEPTAADTSLDHWEGEDIPCTDYMFFGPWLA